MLIRSSGYKYKQRASEKPKLMIHNYKTPGFYYRMFLDLWMFGFSVFNNYGTVVDIPLMKRLEKDWLKWFKKGGDPRYLRDLKTQSGWFPIDKAEKAVDRKVADFKEYFHYFPQHGVPESLENDTKKHYDQMLSFSTNLLRGLEVELRKTDDDKLFRPVPERNCPDLYSIVKGGDANLLRILHYPPYPEERLEDETIIRANEHTDINVLTLIPRPTEKGLQVRWLDFTGEYIWIDVPCEDDCMIVNVGDALDLASTGIFRSAIHRVVAKTKGLKRKSRISMPFFLHANMDMELAPNLTGRQHLEERLKQLGVK